MQDDVILGILFIVFQDHGPSAVYNSTDFSESETLALGVRTMTALSDAREGELYGPLPTNRDSVLAVAYSFKIGAMATTDERIKHHGRFAHLYVLFHKNRKELVEQRLSFLKFYLNRAIKLVGFHTDDDLVPIKFNHLEKMIQNLALTLEKPQMEFFACLASDEIVPIVENVEISSIQSILLVDHVKKTIKIVPLAVLSPRVRFRLNLALRKYSGEHSRINFGHYKVDFVTDAMMQEYLLQKYGLQEIIRDGNLSSSVEGKVLKDVLLEFSERFFKQIAHDLANEVLQAFVSQEVIDVNNLSNQLGLSSNLLVDFFSKLSSLYGIDQYLTIGRKEDGKVYFHMTSS